MSSNYSWDEVLPDVIEEVDWTQFTEEQMNKICEALDTHVDMSQEIYSYTVPSNEDMESSRWYQKEKSLNENHKYETDWRDKRIEYLESEIKSLLIELRR